MSTGIDIIFKKDNLTIEMDNETPQEPNNNEPSVTVEASWGIFDKHCIHPLMAAQTRSKLRMSYVSGFHAALEFVKLKYGQSADLEELKKEVDRLKSEAEHTLVQYVPKPSNN